MADVPQLPSTQGETNGDDEQIVGTGFYQILALFIVFAVLIAIIVVSSQGGAG